MDFREADRSFLPLSGIVSRQTPRAIYLTGQPGAGKSTVSQMVLRAIRRGRRTWRVTTSRCPTRTTFSS
ncbi:zeta toxin family protein [Streptomyces sp. NPDC002033]|uniref:zeta toxin family protein n=1 Tax=unclassified Streptomyces TaxID=2593676 RepID=UPI003329D970